jgi:signal transduction histidine kinase
LLFLLTVGTLHMSPQGTDAWGAGGVALSAGMCVLLHQVGNRPLSALTAMTGLFLLAQRAYGLVPLFAVILLLGVFVLASGEVAKRGAAVLAAVLVAAAIDAGAELTRHGSWTESAYLVMSTAALGAAAGGDAVRSRRVYLHEVEDRAERAEQSREQLVARRIAEERLSIARDMHDLVAHHLAVISVHAAVADRFLDAQPDVARQSLGQVHGAAASALEELGSLIGILRSGGDVAAPPIEPSPDLRQLPGLMSSFERAGLEITRIDRGAYRQLPPAVELTAYRLVQESLTNAHKHGTGSAELTIRYGAGELVIEIVNATRSPDDTAVGGGHGLLGMRERVVALGGTLRAEHTDVGQFQVRAYLPLAAA